MDAKLETKLDQVIDAIGISETAEIPYLLEVKSLATASQTFNPNIGGHITRATISWPRGCNFLVEVFFRHGTVQFIPTTDIGGTGVKGLALDNYTAHVNPNWHVRRGDPLEMYLINHDNTYDHMISAILHISGDGT